MSNKAHRARRDNSEAEVINALQKCGWLVIKLAQRSLPDLMAFRYADGWPRLIEVKTGKAKLRSTQNWSEKGLRVHVLRSADDVLAWHRQETGSNR